MLAARIDRLPSEDKRLLQVASVVGKDVPFALLQVVAELPDEALRRGLDHLQATEFLYQTGLFPDLEGLSVHSQVLLGIFVVTVLLFTVSASAEPVLRIVTFTATNSTKQQEALNLADEVNKLYSAAKGFQWVKWPRLIRALLDHFVRSDQQRRGNRQAEDLGGLKVDEWATSTGLDGSVSV